MNIKKMINHNYGVGRNNKLKKRKQKQQLRVLKGNTRTDGKEKKITHKSYEQ